MNTATQVAPVLAPSGAVLLATVWAGLGESAPAIDPAALRPRRLLANYTRFLRTRECLGNALVTGCTFGRLFSYVSGSPLVSMTTLGFSSAAYAVTFAGVSACIIAGPFAAAALARRRVPPRRVVRLALTAACDGTGAGVTALSGVAPLPVLLLLVPSLGLVAFCFGLVMPAAVQGALQPVPDMAGAAPAVLGCLQMLGGAASGALVGTLYSRLGAVAMPAVILVCMLLALVVHEAVVRPAGRPLSNLPAPASPPARPRRH